MRVPSAQREIDCGSSIWSRPADFRFAPVSATDNIQLHNIRLDKIQLDHIQLDKVRTSCRRIALDKNGWAQTLIIMMLSLAVFIADASAKRSDRVQEISFTLYRNHLVVAEGSLGGLARRKVLIDTGTNVSIIDTAIADELGLQQTARGNVTVVAGVAQTYFSMLPSLNVGPIHHDSLTVAVASLLWLHEQTGIRVDAVIGVDALAQINFEIDYPSRTIRFGAIRLPRSAVPMAEGDGLPIVQAKLNGAPAKLLVDTGGSALILFAAALPQTSTWGPPGAAIQLSNLAGRAELQPVQLKQARIGNVSLDGSIALIAGAAACCHMQGVLGISSLQFKRIAFDFDRKVVNFELEDGSDVPLYDSLFVSPSCCNPSGAPRMLQMH